MLKNLFSHAKKQTAPSCAVVIVAAGTASRMQGEDKILSQIGGKPVIAHTIEAFLACSAVTEIIVVTREDLIAPIQTLCTENHYSKVSAIVPGGKTRVHSVMLGLDRVQDKSGFAAIHDGARPLVTAAVISQTIEKAATYHAAAPAIPVKDTIKIAQNHLVTSTPQRENLFAVQTPQVFDFDLLRGALKKALDENAPITDDCSAVEAIGMRVYLSEGDEENIKITTPLDLLLAEAIWERRNQT